MLMLISELSQNVCCISELAACRARAAAAQ
jgi:hypothetical protein